MKPEESFSNRFELYELKNYIFAKKHRQALQDEFEEIEQALYDDAPMGVTRFNYELGKIYFGSGGSLEDFVINMIEKKDFYRRHLRRFQEQEELFDLAVEQLTPREKDVIQVHYFNRKNDLGLSLEYFTEILHEAENKLCSVIGNERMKQREAVEQERQKQLKIEVNEWKRGRVKIS
jgi:hypothetical protein